MASIVSPPHITASEGSWTVGAWAYALDGAAFSPLGEAVPSWDFDSRLRLGCDYQVDVERLRAETGLPSDAPMELVLVADCRAVGRRWVADRAALRGESVRGHLRADFPPGEVAEVVSLERQVVLGADVDAPPPTPTRKGSVLLGDERPRRVVLEGEGGRFPVEVRDLSAAGHGTPAWLLDLDVSDVTAPFLSAARLYINSAHPASEQLLARGEGQDEAALGVLHWDVMRQLVVRSAVAEVEVGPEMPEGSLGAVLWSLLHDRLGMESLAEVRAMAETSPERLESRLQTVAGLLR